MNNTLYWILVVIIAIITCTFIVSRQPRKNRKYDERQEAVCNRSFKYGFVATAIAEFIVLFIGDRLKWPVSASIMPLLIGCDTAIISDILQSSYFPFNQKRKETGAWILTAIGVLNTIFCLYAWHVNSLVDNLENLLCWISAVLIGLVILYTDFRDKRDQE